VAAKKGVSSANFYLGMIHYEGIYVRQDPELALDYYIKGAAKNNAFCFFELSRIYAEG
jgi:TPR repeat protein